MNDRPGYGCYLANLYKLYYYYGFIKCKKDGGTVYYRDNTKGVKKIVTIVALYLLACILLLIPFLYFSKVDDRWYFEDCMMLLYPMAYALLPLIFSLRFWSSSFEFVSAEKVAEKKAAIEKRKFGHKGYFAALIVIFTFISIFYFTQSFSAAYIRYAIDIATHNQSDWPRAEARVITSNNFKMLSTPQGFKGDLTDSPIVRISIDVSNSPDATSVTLNGVSLLPYKSAFSRYHELFSDDYFFQFMRFEVPASLFQPVNTLHVESGIAKRDWTIEITNIK